MSFSAAVRMGITTLKVTARAAVAEAPLTDIRPGLWAAWAAAGRAAERAESSELGGACRTDSGREGRLVEILDGDRLLRVCLEI